MGSRKIIPALVVFEGRWNPLCFCVQPAMLFPGMVLKCSVMLGSWICQHARLQWFNNCLVDMIPEIYRSRALCFPSRGGLASWRTWRKPNFCGNIPILFKLYLPTERAVCSDPARVPVWRVGDSVGSSGAARQAGGVKCSFISSAFPGVCALP